MKRQIQVTIRRVDNGFIIHSQGDNGSSQKIASTPEQAKTIAGEMIAAAFTSTESQPQ